MGIIHVGSKWRTDDGGIAIVTMAVQSLYGATLFGIIRSELGTKMGTWDERGRSSTTGDSLASPLPLTQKANGTK